MNVSKKSTRLLFRVIALAMLLFTLWSLAYALFHPEYNGFHLFGFPANYIQARIVRCC